MLRGLSRAFLSVFHGCHMYPELWVCALMASCLRRVQYRARRQVYDIEVETSLSKPLEDQIPVVDGVLQNPEIQAVRLCVFLLEVLAHQAWASWCYFLTPSW